MEQLHNIYDRASKRCISLSKRTTLLLINGLYDKDYPLDSEVEYHWTEHHSEDLHRTLADTIITINHSDSYHMEIQMYPDKEIVLRVFEYGYHHAVTNRDGTSTLYFPTPIILYLYEDGNAPEYQQLTIHFGEQGKFIYRVPTFKYLKMSPEELNRRKLIVLIPFQLLRLRKAIEKERTPKNLEALKHLISHDIIESIKENIAAGNITVIEGQKLQRITLQLYRHIYEKYEEMEKAGVNEMAEEALILDIDIIEWEHKKELKKIVQEKDAAIQALVVEKDAAIQALASEKDAAIKKMIVKFRSLGVSEEEILDTTGLTREELQNLENE